MKTSEIDGEPLYVQPPARDIMRNHGDLFEFIQVRVKRVWMLYTAKQLKPKLFKSASTASNVIQIKQLI